MSDVEDVSAWLAGALPVNPPRPAAPAAAEPVSESPTPATALTPDIGDEQVPVPAIRRASAPPNPADVRAARDQLAATLALDPLMDVRMTAAQRGYLTGAIAGMTMSIEGLPPVESRA